MKQLQGRLAHSESLGANQWPTVRVRPPTSAGRQAPALSFASTAMPALVRGPQLPWSLDTPEGGGWRSRIWLHFQFVLCHSPPLQKPKWLWFLGLYLRIRVVGPRLLREPGAAEALEESQVTYWSRPWETSAGLL